MCFSTHLAGVETVPSFMNQVFCWALPVATSAVLQCTTEMTHVRYNSRDFSGALVGDLTKTHEINRMYTYDGT